jgi:hypothetical protein
MRHKLYEKRERSTGSAAVAKSGVSLKQCCGSGIEFQIPDPDFSIPDPGSASKNLSILIQKVFLSSRKYDPGCSSRIRILIFTHPGFRILRNIVFKGV